MGSIAIVLILFAAGIAIGRIAGRSLVAQGLLALLATLLVSVTFLLIISGG